MNLLESIQRMMSAGVGMEMFAQFGDSSFGPPPIFMFFFVAIFVLVIGGFLFNIGKGVTEWASNNSQSEQCDEVRILSRRTDVSGGEKSTRTTYYITFEMNGGGRKEMEVEGRDYGQSAEGDCGQLRHQGTRFLGFTLARGGGIKARTVDAAVPENLACTYCGNAIPAGEIKCAGCGWTWKPTQADE